MAISVAQSAASFWSTSFANLDTAFSGANTAGNLILVFVLEHLGNGTNGLAVSDSNGNTYTQAFIYDNAWDTQQFCYVAKNINAGSNTVTVFKFFEGGVNIVVVELSGADSTTPINSSVQNSANNFTAPILDVDISLSAAKFVMYSGGAITFGSGSALSPTSPLTTVVDNESGSNGQLVAYNQYSPGSYTLAASGRSGGGGDGWSAVALILNAAAVAATGKVKSLIGSGLVQTGLINGGLVRCI